MIVEYSISQVSNLLNLPSSTIRYYDSLNLLPNLQKSAQGVRRFSPDDLNTLRVIDCLKRAGLSMKEIKRFSELSAEGDASIAARRALFYHARDEFSQKLAEMQETMDVLNFKCRYYDQALADGTEEQVQKDLPLSEIVPIPEH